ncbi:MAG: hypothetical protein ACJ0Q4_01795 [Gammaproteobacteria bacterium]
MLLSYPKLKKISILFFYSILVLFSHQKFIFADVLTSVHDWANAWSSQKVSPYLESYAKEFIPSKGNTREAWKKQRQTRLLSPSYIEVVLSDIKISQHAEDYADVVFIQNYRSDNYTDTVNKQLTMRKIKDKWLITKEKIIAARENIQPQSIDDEIKNEATLLDLENSIQEAINNWSEVWSTQNIDAYFAAYAENFIPSKTTSRKKWKKQRRNRILAPTHIKVNLSDTKIILRDSSHADVEFTQNYQSSNYVDDVRKLISMQRVDDRWLITREKAKPIVRNNEDQLFVKDEIIHVAELDSGDDDTINYEEVVSDEDASSKESILRRRDVPTDTVLEERSGSPRHEGHQAPPEMDPVARPSEFERELFGSDPVYPDDVYDVAEQIKIYGGKTPFDEPRPVLEFGYPLYSEGALGKTYNVIGEKNLLRPQLLVYGDFRSALAFNNNGNQEIGQIAARLNLDIDLKLTATERMHMFIRPIDKNNNFLRHEFFGNDHNEFDFVLDTNLETIYFEGDIGAIQSGLTNEWATYELPFAFGFMPLLFQNGIWLDDAFVGVAFAIPAMNSPKFDISNMDISFFTGFDKVTTAAIQNADGQLEDSKGNVFGINAFVEARKGYLEAGYGFIDDKRNGSELSGFDHHSLTAAWTKRYRGKLSNSIRGIWTFGQSPNGSNTQTADGFALLVENSLITSKPSFLVPYGNFFVGVDRPQPLVRGNDGLLKNTGIAFETDGLTGFPKLDSSAQDVFGGAIGIEYLFDLSRQVVFEVAALQPFGGQSATIAGDQYGLSARYQHNLNDRWLIRTDAMIGILSNAENISGIRVELRRKF